MRSVKLSSNAIVEILHCLCGHIHGTGMVSVLTLVLAALLWAAPAEAQQLGHKVLGSVGMLAGSQPDSGLYIVDQFASYGADALFDRAGRRIAAGLDLMRGQTRLASS